jgi:hypothetical protein
MLIRIPQVLSGTKLADCRKALETAEWSDGKTTAGYLNMVMTIFVVTCVCSLVLWSIARWIGVWMGKRAVRAT